MSEHLFEIPFVKDIKGRYLDLLELSGGLKSVALEHFANLVGFPAGGRLPQTKESVEKFFSIEYNYYKVFADESDDPCEDAKLCFGEEPDARQYQYGEDWEKVVEDYESAIKEHIETFPERLRNKRFVEDILKLSPEEYVRRVEDEITHIAQERINDYPSRFKDDISSDVENHKELPFMGDFKNALYDYLRNAHINQVNETGFNPRFIKKGPILSQDVIDKKMLNILDVYESNPLHKNSVSAIKDRFVITGEKENREIHKRVSVVNRLRGLMSDGFSSLRENALQPVTIKDIEDVVSQVEEPRKVFVTGWCKEDEDFIVKTVNDCTENLKASLVHVALPLKDKAFRYDETVEFLLGHLYENNIFKKEAYNNFSEQLKDVIENPETYSEELSSFAKNHLEFIHNARIDKAQRNLEVMADFAYGHGCPSNKMYHEAAMMAKTDTPEEWEALRRFKKVHNIVDEAEKAELTDYDVAMARIKEELERYAKAGENPDKTVVAGIAGYCCGIKGVDIDVMSKALSDAGISGADENLFALNEYELGVSVREFLEKDEEKEVGEKQSSTVGIKMS